MNTISTVYWVAMRMKRSRTFMTTILFLDCFALLPLVIAGCGRSVFLITALRAWIGSRLNSDGEHRCISYLGAQFAPRILEADIMRRLITVLALVTVMGLHVAQTIAAPIYLRVEGIPGEVVNAPYEEWIDVAKFGIGMSRTIPEVTVPRTLGESIPVTLQVTTTGVSKASPRLWEAVAHGMLIPDVELAVLKTFPSGDKPYIEFQLGDSIAINYVLFTDDDGLLVETVEFDYVEMVYRYLFYDDDGSLLGEVEAFWEPNSPASSSFSFVASDSTATIPEPLADFNQDGNVDMADLTQWQSDFGVNAESDADRDGDSDGYDFLTWQQQFGMDTDTLGNAVVPEPASIVLFLTFSALALARCQMRRK